MDLFLRLDASVRECVVDREFMPLGLAVVAGAVCQPALPAAPGGG